MIPNSLKLSRSTLLLLSNGIELRKHQLFALLFSEVLQNVLKQASEGDTKSYIFIIENSKNWDRILNLLSITYSKNTIDLNIFLTEFVDILKNEFIDCDVHYLEKVTADPTIIHHMYTIDWS